MSQPVSKSASALGGGIVVQKQKAGVYTVLLVLSLLAILVGCALLYAVVQRYDGKIAPTAQAQPGGAFGTSAPFSMSSANAALA